MVEPAPGLFSTTTGWPQLSLSFCATDRASTSVVPPGGKGTTMVMVLDGYACAKAEGVVRMAAAMAMAPAVLRIVAIISLSGVCSGSAERRRLLLDVAAHR